MESFFRKFLNGNEWYWRLLRTILQGIIGVVIANIDMLIEPLQIDTFWKAMIVAVVMAVLSPLMAELGKGADVIAAHHPHCLQRMERLGDTYVAYSLGAFCISPSADYLCKESLPEYGAAWHIDIDEETRSVKGTSVRILKSIEDKDHYVHVVEAEEDSPQVRQIRTRLGLDRTEQNA